MTIYPVKVWEMTSSSGMIVFKEEEGENVKLFSRLPTVPLPQRKGSIGLLDSADRVVWDSMSGLI
jgi:hypothetical protein